MKSLTLIKANVVHNWQRSNAFFGNNWTNVFSTFFYSITAVAAINLIFASIDSIGGLNKDEIIYIALWGQLGFYVSIYVTLAPLKALVEDIHSGSLDSWLIRPVSLLSQYMSSHTDFVAIARDAIPSFGVYILAISWNNLNLGMLDTSLAFLFFVMTFYITYRFYLILASTAFWQGEASSALGLMWTLDGQSLPFNLAPNWYKTLGYTVAPQMLMRILPGTYALGVLSFWPVMIPITIAIIVTYILSRYIFNKGLKKYGSASS